MSNLNNLYGEVTVTDPGAGPATGGRSSWERSAMRRRSILNAVGLAQIAGAIVCQPVLGANTLLFTNTGGGLNAPVLDLHGNPLLPSDDYRIGLFLGIYEDAMHVASLTAPAVFTSPGVFGEGDAPITLRNLDPFPQSAYWFEVRVWNTRGGKYLTYSDAWDHGETQLGRSALFQLTVPWGDTSATPPVPAPPLYGLTSFTFPVVNPSIKVSAPSIGTNGFTFTVTGPANAPLEIQAATNLTSQTWVPLLTGTLTNGSYTYTEAQWTNSPSRFYRVRSP